MSTSWTHAGGAYTAMVLMHEMRDGTYVISNVVRGRWSALEREQMLLQTVRADAAVFPSGYHVRIEQEPGSGARRAWRPQSACSRATASTLTR
jgi:hypothetical protein